MAHDATFGPQLALDGPALLQSVEHALRHLRDASTLGRSRLATWDAVRLRVDGAYEPPTHVELGRAVRKLLDEAIDGLRPVSRQSMEARSWRRYMILDLCYRQQEPSHHVWTAHLAVSKSEFYRERDEAIQALTRMLLDLERCARWSASQSQGPP
jgi:hypothetical protein